MQSILVYILIISYCGPLMLIMFWNHAAIGVFKKIMCVLPNYVSVLYYNAFIRSCFSYGLLFWFNNNRSGRWKLIACIDRIISFLAVKHKLTVCDFVSTTGVFDVWKAHKMQSLALMYDIVHGYYNVSCFQFKSNTWSFYTC